MMNVEPLLCTGQLSDKENNDHHAFTSNQETLTDTRPSSVDNTLKQGRLLFNVPINEEPPAIQSTEGSSQTEPLKGLDTLSSQTTPPNVIPTQSIVTPTRTMPSEKQTPPSNGIPTTPTLSQSCPPKPKLSKAEREKLRAEMKTKREEERVRKEQERLKREQEKHDRLLKKEQEAKERLEKKAKEELEKKEKREKKEAEKKAKEEERKKKEEERKKAELEKEQAKEEKLRREQQKRERFMGFFSRKPKEEVSKPTRISQEYSVLTPFSVGADMTLAKSPRSPLTDKIEFDHLLQAQQFSASPGDCVEMLRGVASEKAEKLACTAVSKTDDDDVIEIKPNDAKKKWHYKLIQFHSNHRPAYYGTWRKKSQLINPRNPSKKDDCLLDYDVDSDDEWEEEDPGESISNSEGEDGDSGEEGDDDEDDDGFFVPHGYLSDGEGDHEEGPIAFDPTGSVDDDESKRKKVADKAKAWEVEFARKCQPIKPVKIGCVWTRVGVEDNLSKDEEFLKQFAAVALVDLPLSLETKKEPRATEGASTGAESTKMIVPEEAVPDLIRLMHGSSIGVNRLIKTFRVHWGAKKSQQTVSSDREDNCSAPPMDTITDSNNHISPSSKTPNPNSPKQSAMFESASGISKRQLEIKLHEIAVKEPRPPSYKSLWYVYDAVLEKYNIDVTTITPLIPLGSPQTTKSVPDTSKSASPVTPCGPGSALNGNSTKSKKGIKRKTDGIPTVKSLFQVLNKQGNSTDNNLPKPKRVKLELHVDRIPPHSTVSIPEKRELEKEEPLLESAAKRLCLDETTKRPADLSTVIVIESDNSKDGIENKTQTVPQQVDNAGDKGDPLIVV